MIDRIVKREQMREEFAKGERPQFLIHYEEFKDDPKWSASFMTEELCEYILFLENKEL